MAGLIDGHIHLNIGGAQAAYELPIPPSADVDEVCWTIFHFFFTE
jgi:predicted amidohydrolase YtcJ